MSAFRAGVRSLVLGALSAWLAACATTDGGRSVEVGIAEPPVERSAVAPVPVAPRSTLAAPAAPEAPHESAGEASADFWTRLVEGFRFGHCDAAPAVLDEAKRYAAGGRFGKTLESMLPKMAFVLEEVERRGLPTEFVLLPIVESHYRLVPGRGQGPAGPWQLVPGTARAHGVRITADYDGRLDLAASTKAALEHIDRLADRFGDDWTAVVKAYNAGEYRVRRARTGARAESVYRGLATTTLTYHARLHALACLVSDPDRFGIELPFPAPDASLSAYSIEADLDLDLAATAAGLDRRQLLAANPAFRGERAPRGSHLVLPTSAAERLAERLEPIPPARRAHWRIQSIDGADWSSLATASGLDASALAAANGTSTERAPPPRLVLPDRSARDALPLADAGTYVVRPGDSPWTIARRLRVGLAELLRVNGLDRRSILKPGQTLRVP